MSSKTKKKKLLHRFQNQNRKPYEVYLVEEDKRFSGDCEEPADYIESPKIRINQNFMEKNRARRQMSVIMEEMLHAHDFTLSEKVVRKYCANTMKLLYKIGWRWHPEEYEKSKDE